MAAGLTARFTLPPSQKYGAMRSLILFFYSLFIITSTYSLVSNKSNGRLRPRSGKSNPKPVIDGFITSAVGEAKHPHTRAISVATPA